MGLRISVLSIATLAAIYFYAHRRRERKTLPARNADHDNTFHTAHLEELMREQLARNYAFLGDAAMERLRSAFVIIVGCGGVGGHAAHMLARSGLGKMRLIDFDNVTLSSLNRAPLATREDVGMPKVTSLALKLKEISPWLRVEPIVDIFSYERAETLLDSSASIVLDCIDNVETKTSLLLYCHQHSIPVISAMGAGCKMDPTKIAICDISKTVEDPLARAVRKRLKAAGVTHGIPVVYSCEKPSGIGLLPLHDAMMKEASDPSENLASPDDFAILPEFRVRIVPVLGPMPAIFGQTMAVYVLRVLSSAAPLEGFSTAKAGTFAYHRYVKELESRERKRKRKAYLDDHPNATQAELVALYKGYFPIRLSDAEYLVETIWQGRSALPGPENGTEGRAKLTLARWRQDVALTIKNVVLLTVHQAVVHDSFSRPELCPHYSADWIAFVDKKLVAC